MGTSARHPRGIPASPHGCTVSPLRAGIVRASLAPVCVCGGGGGGGRHTPVPAAPVSVCRPAAGGRIPAPCRQVRSASRIRRSRPPRAVSARAGGGRCWEGAVDGGGGLPDTAMAPAGAPDRIVTVPRAVTGGRVTESPSHRVIESADVIDSLTNLRSPVSGLRAGWAGDGPVAALAHGTSHFTLITGTGSVWAKSGRPAPAGMNEPFGVVRGECPESFTEMLRSCLITCTKGLREDEHLHDVSILMEPHAICWLPRCHQSAFIETLSFRNASKMLEK